MDIFLVTHEAEYTGAPKILFAIAGYLSAQHKVTLVTKMSGPVLETFSASYPAVDVINVNTNHSVSDASLEVKVATAVTLLRQRKPDFVLVNTIASADWLVATRQMGIPNCLYSHEMIKEYDSLMSCGGTVEDFISYTDYMLMASGSIKDDYEARFGAIDIPCQVINTMIDCNEIDRLASGSISALPLSAQGAEINPHKPIVYACGTACHRKGADLFFSLAESMPKSQFLWIGDWDNAQVNPALTDFKQLKLPNLFISGETSNPYNLMQMSDVFVLTSREDPNPLVVTESLYLGKDCVCFTETGSSKEQLLKTGFVLDGAVNVERLKITLSKILLSNPACGDSSRVQATVGRVRQEYDLTAKIRMIGELLGRW